jgi:hypothetical protein
MKRQFYTFTLILLFCTISQGQSFFSPLIGDLPVVADARSLAVGLSSWGDVGSAAALLTNSALLGLSDQRLSIITGFNAFSINEKRSFPVQDSYGDFLADNTYVINQNWFPDFQLGANFQLWPRLQLAMLINHANLADFQYEEEVRGSLYGEYNRDPLVGYNRMSNRQSIYNTSFGLALNPIKSLWLGLGMNISTTDNAKQTYEIQVIEESNYQSSDHTISYSAKPEFATIVNGNVGLTFDITKHLSISAAYHFPYETVQKGGLLYLMNDSTETLPVMAIDSNSTISKVTRRQPGELRLGFCLKPVNIIPTKLFFELVYQNWKDASVKYQMAIVSAVAHIPINVYTDKIPYRDVIKFHLGIEHVFFSGVPFRLGFFHDPNPVDADLDRNWFTAGTGYQFGNFNLAVSGAFTTSEYEYHDLFPIAAEERVEFDTIRESVIVGIITLRYNF